MIEVEHVVKVFDGVRAVDDVSFHVRAGEAFALLGPNGSGKTTLLKCVMGLLRPSAGRIRVCGIEVGSDLRAALALMSYLPQRVAFPDGLTVREVLAFYARLRGERSERLERACHWLQLDLAELTNRPIGALSSGLLQRVGLAVALLADVPILVLDEPTVSLDPEGVRRLRAVLAELRAEGRTILFSSHVLSDVEALADRVAVLVHGKLVALESVEGIRAQWRQNALTRVHLWHPSERFVEPAYRYGANEAQLLGESLLFRSNASDRLAILRALEAGGAQIETFWTPEPSLEEVYLNHVGEAGAERAPDRGDRLSESATTAGRISSE